jgi:transcriptional regulator with XRE-family HTH domain
VDIVEAEVLDMPGMTGPIVPRRRLAEMLRQLRLRDGRSLEEVARALLISPSKLSRLENAQGTPQTRDVRDLLHTYAVGGDLTGRMMQWVAAARRPGWWSEYRFTAAGSATELDVHVAYEAEAAVSRVYAIPFFPALLQTDPYVRALYRSLDPWRSAREIEQLVELRRRRRALLDQPPGRPPLRLVAVCHESAVRQVVGTAAVLRGQLAALLPELDRPNVDLRILPFTADLPFTATGMYTSFEFADELDRDVVHIETHAGYRLLETADSVALYRGYFAEVLRRSLTPQASRELLQAAAQGR